MAGMVRSNRISAPFIDADSVVIIGDSVADSVADSVVRRRLSRPPVADQSSTSRRLGFYASYEKVKYRAINTYVRYVPTIRDLADARPAIFDKIFPRARVPDMLLAFFHVSPIDIVSDVW